MDYVAISTFKQFSEEPNLTTQRRATLGSLAQKYQALADVSILDQQSKKA